MKIVGLRKLILGLVFLGGVFGLAALDLYFNQGANLGGVAAVGVSATAGVAAIVYGNVKENQVKTKA